MIIQHDHDFHHIKSIEPLEEIVTTSLNNAQSFVLTPHNKAVLTQCSRTPINTPHLCRNIPHWQYTPPELPLPPNIDRPCPCTLLTHQGYTCTLTFRATQARVMHQLSTKWEHGNRQLGCMAVIDNQCPACNRMLSTIAYTRHHVVRSLEHNICSHKGPRYPYPLFQHT